MVFNNEVPNEAEREIGALVSLDEGFDVAALREALKKRLPSYMVPTRIQETSEAFARTPAGKYDRKLATKMVFE